MQVREDRAQHRVNRAKTSVPVLALVGYTNAGKSCLMNQLTLADVLSEDALFATLDTTVRKLMLPSGLQVGLQVILSSDMWFNCWYTPCYCLQSVVCQPPVPCRR